MTSEKHNMQDEEQNKSGNSNEDIGDLDVGKFLGAIFGIVFIPIYELLDKIVRKFQTLFLAAAVFGLTWVAFLSHMERSEKIYVFLIFVVTTLLHGIERYEQGKFDTDEVMKLLEENTKSNLELAEKYKAYKIKKLDEIDNMKVFRGARVLLAFFMAYLTGMVVAKESLYYALFTSLVSWVIYTYLFYYIVVWKKKDKFGPFPNLKRDFGIEIPKKGGSLKYIFLMLITSAVSILLFCLYIHFFT